MTLNFSSYYLSDHQIDTKIKSDYKPIKYKKFCL